MNRLAQFLHYAQKVFALKTVLRAVRDARPWAKIRTTPVLLTLVLGVVLRISSYLDLAQQTKRRRWRHLCALQAAISDDTFQYVTERLELEDLRWALASVAKTLKQNKVLESCQINGLLFLSLDANEHFKSRSRVVNAVASVKSRKSMSRATSTRSPSIITVTSSPKSTVRKSMSC